MSDLFTTSQQATSVKKMRKFFWLTGGLFIYILFNNLVGTMPYGVPATQSISNNFSMAIVVLVFFVAIGIIRTGSGFFKHMAGPIWWIAPLIFVIEAFGTFIVRPLTLSIRLTGNINGDHKVMEVAYHFLSIFSLPQPWFWVLLFLLFKLLCSQS